MRFLIILICLPGFLQAQVSYGANRLAGKYATMADGTPVYYEAYGEGPCVVLLHGGLFGEIAEFSQLIPALAQHHRLLAVNTRGHGKSGIGHQPYTYQLMAEDVYTIVKKETRDSILLVGFSDGAVTAMALTIAHPELVKKLVFAGGNLEAGHLNPAERQSLEAWNGDSITHQFPEFVRKRKAVMEEPNRWNEFIVLLKHAWLQHDYIDMTKLAGIKCPVLVIGGDRDQFNGLDNFTGLYKKLPHAQLGIVPDSDHTIFENQPELLALLVLKFLQ